MTDSYEICNRIGFNTDMRCNDLMHNININILQICNRHLYWNVLGIFVVPSFTLLRGSIFHGPIDIFMKNKLDHYV